MNRHCWLRRGLASILVALLVASAATAQDTLVPVVGWQPVYQAPYPTALFAWTPKAEYHRAAVLVRSDSGAAGSGTQFVCGELAGILTAKHVVDKARYATIRFADGTSKRGPVIVSSYGDVAYVAVFNPNLPHVHVAEKTPPVGAWTETFGFGGPKDTLRHFSGKIIRHTTTTTYFSQSVLNGDSGGGILDANHELIGVNSFGTGSSYDGAIAYYGSWPIYDDSGSTHHTHIKGFLSRLCRRFRRRAQFGGHG